MNRIILGIWILIRIRFELKIQELGRLKMEPWTLAMEARRLEKARNGVVKGISISCHRFALP
jgi:hypothetical protein